MMKRAGNDGTGLAHNQATLGATPRPATRIINAATWAALFKAYGG